MKKILSVIAVAGLIALALAYRTDKFNGMSKLPFAAEKPGAASVTLEEDTHHPSAAAVKSVPFADAFVAKGLGGPRLNLQDSLMDELAQKGAERSVSALVSFATGTCFNEAWKDEDAKKDPERAWAIDYLATACEGFDPERFKVKYADHPDLNSVDLRVGEEAALKIALADLKTTDSYFDLTMAGWYLIERNQLPNQADYRLDQEQLARAFALASALRTCASMNACGSQSLMTAQVCATHGCPPGTNYAQAMRSILSPKEYQAAQRIMTTLASL